MEWKSNGDIRWIEFNIYDVFPLKHGIFSRHGGISPFPWQSLNLGGTVGDLKSSKYLTNFHSNMAYFLVTVEYHLFPGRA